MKRIKVRSMTALLLALVLMLQGCGSSGGSTGGGGRTKVDVTTSADTGETAGTANSAGTATTDSAGTDTTKPQSSGRTADLETAYFGFRVREESVDDLWMNEYSISATPRFNRVEFQTFSSDGGEVSAFFDFQPCTDLRVSEMVEQGYEVLGVLTLPNGYPLWLTVRSYEESDEGAAWIAKHKAELYDGIFATAGATWEPGVQYTGKAIADFSSIAGTWYEEGRGEESALNVTLDGCVSAPAQGISYMEQYVYCVPESDTVFRLYDDTNSPYSDDSYFLLEDGGTMAWCEGMGAIRYVREPQSGAAGIAQEIYGAWRSDDDGSVIVFYENDTFEWTGFYQNADGQETAAYVTGTMTQIGFDEEKPHYYLTPDEDMEWEQFTEQMPTWEFDLFYSEGAGEYILDGGPTSHGESSYWMKDTDYNYGMP